MKNAQRLAWALAAAGMALAGCETPEEELPRSVTTALETCFNRNDATACAELFREDAEIFPHGARLVRGRNAIHDWYKDQIAKEFALDTESQEQLVRDGIAIDQGTYRVRNVRAGRDVEMGNYLHVWTRAEGDWKLFRVMYNTEVAPRAEVSVGVEAAEQVPGR